MQGSKSSKTSKDLGNVIAQLKSGKTRGSVPRDLHPEEITALEQKRDALQDVMKQGAKERAVEKIKRRSTVQAVRVVGENEAKENKAAEQKKEQPAAAPLAAGHQATQGRKRLRNQIAPVVPSSPQVVRVSATDSNGCTTNLFRMPRDAPMKSFMQAWCEHHEISVEVIFLYENIVLSPETTWLEVRGGCDVASRAEVRAVPLMWCCFKDLAEVEPSPRPE